MVASFNGWGTSWAQTWDRISDPSAMYGSAAITISATGTLTSATTTRRGSGKARKQRYVVDRFSDWPKQPETTESDDEECLLLMMI